MCVQTSAVTPIQKLVLDRLAALNLSYREAAEASGGLISHGYLNQLSLGRLPKAFRGPVINGIALALDVPVSVVQQAVDGSLVRSPQDTVFKLPTRAETLTPKEQKAVLSYIDALLSHRMNNRL
jgi:hypothetical protein